MQTTRSRLVDVVAGLGGDGGNSGDGVVDVVGCARNLYLAHPTCPSNSTHQDKAKVVKCFSEF